ncbi:MAG: hypothetical protein O2919_00970 [Chloroflexi bacterium]|nr:hypothetical protein [Chloroflexota bacterium]
MIKARYGHVLIRSAYAPVDPAHRRGVTVSRIEELAALADSRHEPIIYVETPTETSFFVQDLPNSIYSFVLPNAGGEQGAYDPAFAR